MSEAVKGVVVVTVYVWLAVVTLPQPRLPLQVVRKVLSPKLQKYLAIVPSGSVLAAALKLTVSGELPLNGVAVKLAVGNRSARKLRIDV